MTRGKKTDGMTQTPNVLTLGIDNTNLVEGWAKPEGSTKWHFFVKGKSLCGQPAALYSGPLRDFNHTSPHNCSTCINAHRARKKRVHE